MQLWNPWPLAVGHVLLEICMEDSFWTLKLLRGLDSKCLYFCYRTTIWEIDKYRHMVWGKFISEDPYLNLEFTWPTVQTLLSENWAPYEEKKWSKICVRKHCVYCDFDRNNVYKPIGLAAKLNMLIYQCETGM